MSLPQPLHGWLTTGHSPEHSTAATPSVTWPWPEPSGVFWDWPQTEHGLRTLQGQHEGVKTLPWHTGAAMSWTSCEDDAQDLVTSQWHMG